MQQTLSPELSAVSKCPAISGACPSSYSITRLWVSGQPCKFDIPSLLSFRWNVVGWLKMLISHLPVDFWKEFGKKVQFDIVYRLYASGDALLNAKLTKHGGITDMYLTFYGEKSTLGWLPMLSYFSTLRRFVYDSGALTSNVSYFPSKSELSLLLKTLEEFCLHADGAENAFWADEHPSPSFGGVKLGVCLNVSELWPILRSFDVVQYSAYSYPLRTLGEVLKTLPASLQRIKIRSSDALPYLQYFPRGLQTLLLENGELAPSHFLCLPPTLTELSAKLDPFLDYTEQLRDLPQSLLALTLTQDFPSCSIQYLPPALTYLNIATSAASFQDIATHLTSLKYLILDRDSPANPNIPEYTGPLKYIPHIRRREESHFWRHHQELGWIDSPPTDRPLPELPAYYH